MSRRRTRTVESSQINRTSQRIARSEAGQLECGRFVAPVVSERKPGTGRLSCRGNFCYKRNKRLILTMNARFMSAGNPLPSVSRWSL